MNERVSPIRLVTLSALLAATAAACGGAELVKSDGAAQHTTYGSADAAEQALTPDIVIGSTWKASRDWGYSAAANSYGSADSAEQWVKPGYAEAVAALSPEELAATYGNERFPGPTNDQLSKAYGNPTFNVATPRHLPTAGELILSWPQEQRAYVDGVITPPPVQLPAAGDVAPPLEANP